MRPHTAIPRLFLCCSARRTRYASSQISQWQLGGQTGLEWATSDSNRIFIDFATTPGAIQPI